MTFGDASAMVSILNQKSDAGELAARLDVADDTFTSPLSTFARYGKGQGHNAPLDAGDCFAYAAARHHGAALLFKVDDFAHTDVVAG